LGIGGIAWQLGTRGYGLTIATQDGDAVPGLLPAPEFVAAAFARASKLADGCESGLFASYLQIVVALVRRITVAQDHMMIEIGCEAVTKSLLDRETPSQSRRKNHPPILLDVPVRLWRRGVEAKLVVLDQKQAPSEPDANLIKALTRAHDWFGRIVRGEATGIGDIARAERLDRTYITRVICLAFLAPEITKAIVEGRQPTELTAKRLIKSALKVPLLWVDQSKPTLETQL
jgi:site-specific DNA recombinase